MEFYANEVEFQVATETRAILATPEYEGLHYEEMIAEFDYIAYVTGSGYEAEVIVGVENGATVPSDLAQQLDDQLSKATGLDLTVRVVLLNEQVSR